MEIIINKSVSDEMKSSYITYAMSVIISRALPDVRDGLKPVHRRILYVLHRLGLTYGRPFKKSANIVGQVISNYHPHGDAAIYDSLVRMAQDFSLRYMLVDGQGNFGSMDGDKAAAYRYTEVRMQRITEEMLRDLEKETVDFTLTFDDVTKEPTVLPAVLPNLLINGASGIAVGMATNMPPHHLGEVLDATMYALKNPGYTTQDLRKFIKGPDFPTGAFIHDGPGLTTAYEKGRGSFIIQSRSSIEEYDKNREAIIFTEIPYQVNKAEAIIKIASLIKMGTIAGVSELRDESDKDGVRIVVELKKDVNANTVLNLIYKHSPLQISYGINNVALVDGKPKLLSLCEIIAAFISHRYEVVTRRTKYLLRKAEERLHILEGFIEIALPNLDEVVAIIRKSRDVATAREALIKAFTLSVLQCNAILDLRLSRLVSIEIEKLREERSGLQADVATYKHLLANDEKVYGKIEEELIELKERYNDERRSEIIFGELTNLEDEAFIENLPVVVSFTQSGYVKSMPLDVYRQQNRGGVGIKGTNTKKDEDALALLFGAMKHDFLLMLSSFGKIFLRRTYEIPTAGRTSRGAHVRTLLDLDKGEAIKTVVSSHGDFLTSNASLVMISRGGIIKRTYAREFGSLKRRGLRAMNVREGDEVVSMVRAEDENGELMYFSRSGLAIRIRLGSLRPMGRAASGVIAMRLASDDVIISLLPVTEQSKMLVVSDSGHGKIIPASDFGIKGRGGKGMLYFPRSEKSGKLACVMLLSDPGDILITSSTSNVLRIAQCDIPVLSRTARGNRLVKLKEGVVSDVTIAKELKVDDSL